MVTIYARQIENDSAAKAPGRGERRAAVLAYFAEHPASSVSAAQEALGIPIATLNRDIAALREEGRLTREGRRGNWEVAG